MWRSSATLAYADPARTKETLKHMFMIVDAESDRPIGWCNLFFSIPENRHAMLAIMIGEREFWGRGYGEDAVRLTLDYGFNVLNLNSAELGVYTFDDRAVRCCEKVGFKRIGIPREARIVAGAKYDTILMDIFASEFESPVVEASIRTSQARTRSDGA